MIDRNCDWFIALFVPLVIVIALVLVFPLSFENRSIEMGPRKDRVKLRPGLELNDTVVYPLIGWSLL